jgi:threonine/homoserine/homoserine lactone efflux protein
MLLLLAKIFPLALGEMISPVVLSVMLVILTNKKSPLGRAISFLIGMAIAVVILGFIGLYIGKSIPGARHSSTMTFWVDLILGLILLILGVRAIFKKPKQERQEEKENSKQAQEFGQKHLLKWGVLGFVLNMLNFSSIVFYFAATKEIGQSDVTSLAKLLLTLFCGFFFMLPIVLPVVIYGFWPKMAKKILDPIHFAITNYGNYINMVILFGFGFYLLYKAFSIYF